MKVALTVVAGPGAGTVREFAEPRGFVIGRAKDADYVLPADDGHVSRRHAFLEICPPNCHVRDIGGTNPMAVNGTEVKEANLKHGDILELGYTRFQVSVTEVAPPLPDVKCLKCDRVIVLGPGGAVPDFCADCEAVRKSRMLSAPPIAKGTAKCWVCGLDVSGRANSDGRALELAGIALYSCDSPKCLRFNDKVRGTSIGDYELLRQLGEGGMGVVHLAHHSPTGRLVAIKQIKDLTNESLRKRFEREIRLAQSVVHKNIVRCFDTGSHADGPFIVTEFVTGGDLEHLVQKEGGKLKADMAVRFARQVLDATAFLHQLPNPIVHRDIKPFNILVRGEDHVKLTDFGLAKEYQKAGGITHMNVGMGTLMYMSPEQVKNVKDVGPPADVYSIGVTLYYLLSGQYTFNFPTPKEIAEFQKQNPDKGRSPQEALEWKMREQRIKHPHSIILSDTPIPLRERAPSIPKYLADVVDKAVKKEIGERYATAAEFRTALERAI